MGVLIKPFFFIQLVTVATVLVSGTDLMCERVVGDEWWVLSKCLSGINNWSLFTPTRPVDAQPMLVKAPTQTGSFLLIRK